MGVTVTWETDAKTILLWRFEEPWAWDDVFASLDTVNAMLDGVLHTVDFIAVFPENTPLPLKAFTNYRMLFDRRHPNRGKLVLVGNTMYLKALTDSFTRLYNVTDANFAFAYSVAEARAIVQHSHVTI